MADAAHSRRPHARDPQFAGPRTPCGPKMATRWPRLITLLSTYRRGPIPGTVANIGAEGGTRTHTGREPQRCLRPSRLPVPPLRPGSQHRATRRGPQAGATRVLGGWVGWSGRRGSNPRPPPWQGGALPLSYFRRTAFNSTGAPAATATDAAWRRPGRQPSELRNSLIERLCAPGATPLSGHAGPSKAIPPREPASPSVACEAVAAAGSLVVAEGVARLLALVARELDTPRSIPGVVCLDRRAVCTMEVPALFAGRTTTRGATDACVGCVRRQ